MSAQQTLDCPKCGTSLRVSATGPGVFRKCCPSCQTFLRVNAIKTRIGTPHCVTPDKEISEMVRQAEAEYERRNRSSRTRTRTLL